MERRTGIALALAYGLVYLILGPGKVSLDSHYPIAEAFLAGRLHLVDPIPWLELVPRPEGGWYSPFPPLLSVLLMPAAALDVLIDTNLLAALFGGLSVFLVWELMGRLGVERRARVGLTVGWGLGSQVLWIAAEGGQHQAPQMAAAALLLASLVLGIGRRAPVLAGLLLAGAAAARLPVGLALPVLVYMYRPQVPAASGGRPTGGADARLRPWLPFVVAFAVPLGMMALYNVARFGSPVEFGYGLIRDVEGRWLLDEPWYQHGMVSLAYLPRQVHSMLLRGLEWQEGFPWVYSNLSGTSVLLTMPILWWVFGARGRLAFATGLSAVLVFIPILLHGNPVAGVGYRYILDALPLLWLLLGLSLRDGIPRPAVAALIAGVVANVWLCAVYWYQLAGT